MAVTSSSVNSARSASVCAWCASAAVDGSAGESADGRRSRPRCRLRSSDPQTVHRDNARRGTSPRIARPAPNACVQARACVLGHVRGWDVDAARARLRVVSARSRRRNRSRRRASISLPSGLSASTPAPSDCDRRTCRSTSGRARPRRGSPPASAHASRVARVCRRSTCRPVDERSMRARRAVRSYPNQHREC